MKREEYHFCLNFFFAGRFFPFFLIIYFVFFLSDFFYHWPCVIKQANRFSETYFQDALKV